MKILFAVSNENVSNRIVDSYKKRYQDTVSFKNVFYFNAIIRELQRDKSYDSIVISEDLEPFANSNYDVYGDNNEPTSEENLAITNSDVDNFNEREIANSFFPDEDMKQDLKKIFGY